MPHRFARAFIRTCSHAHPRHVLARRSRHRRTRPAMRDRRIRLLGRHLRARFADAGEVPRGIRRDRVRRARSASGASAAKVAFIPRTAAPRVAGVVLRNVRAQLLHCVDHGARTHAHGCAQSRESHPAAGNTACFAPNGRQIVADAQTYGRPYETTVRRCARGRRGARGGVSEGCGNCLFSLRNLLTRALDSNSFCAGVTN